jgi:hypothetical protein
LPHRSKSTVEAAREKVKKGRGALIIMPLAIATLVTYFFALQRKRISDETPQAWRSRMNEMPPQPRSTEPDAPRDMRPASQGPVEPVTRGALPELDETAFRNLIGKTLVDINGDGVGEIEAAYYRRMRGEPEWAAVSIGLIDRRRVLVPLDAATVGEQVAVPYPKDMIEASPATDAEVVDEPDEMQLFIYYGARRILPGVESERRPEAVTLRMWAPPERAAEETR